MRCQAGHAMARTAVRTCGHHRPHATTSSPVPSAYVYCGPGAGFRSALSAVQSLREALVGSVRVDRLTPDQLLSSGWQEGCLLLVFPGGADLPYCRELNGEGNRIIREYVEGGGTYMGLCAGAYYGCARVEFEPGTSLEVVGDRELAFFPGVARGSIYQGFRYESEAGAAAAPLRYLDLLPPTAPSSPPSNGAQRQQGAWAEAPSAAAEPPRSPGSPPPRERQQQAQQGQQPGPSSQRWRQCEDYINGGPGFFSLDGALISPQEPPPGVQVLATYPERGGAAAALLCCAGRGRAVLCGTHPELHPSWLEPCLAVGGDAAACSDRAARDGNGGVSAGAAPMANAAAVAAAAPGEPSSSTAALGRTQQWLGSSDSAALDGDGAAAAAASDANGSSSSSSMSPESKGGVNLEVQHLRRLHARLAASQVERWRYWRGLLVAAGLAGWLRPEGGEQEVGCQGGDSLQTLAGLR